MNKKYFKEEEHLLIGAPLKYLKIFYCRNRGNYFSRSTTSSSEK